MTLIPILYAPLAIQIHMGAARPALLVGPFVLFRHQGDSLHRWLGHTWIISMVVLAVSRLFIPSGMAIISHFGPIHLFCIFALWRVAEGLFHIRRGDIRKHRAFTQNVWFGAMGFAGVFTLLPGRRLNQMLFGASEHLGWAAIALGLCGLAFLWRRQNARLTFLS